MPNNEPGTVFLDRLERNNDALLAYVLRNATIELNHDVILAYVQRQKELCEDLKRAQLLDQLSLSVEFRQELAGAFRKERERLRKDGNGE